MDKLLSLVGRYRKGIASGLGSALAILELSLAPHTTAYIAVGMVLAALSTVGVVAVAPNDPAPPKAAEEG